MAISKNTPEVKAAIVESVRVAPDWIGRLPVLKIARQQASRIVASHDRPAVLPGVAPAVRTRGTL